MKKKRSKRKDRMNRNDYLSHGIDVFSDYEAEISAEGLGGSSIKKGNNIINQEMYFREKTKQLLNKEALEDMLEERGF